MTNKVLRNVPKIHLRCPNDDVHAEGLIKMIEFAERKGLRDSDRVSYYVLARDSKLDWEEIEFPDESMYVLKRASSISVKNLKGMIGEKQGYIDDVGELYGWLKTRENEPEI
jgi:hypothetical protein